MSKGDHRALDIVLAEDLAVGVGKAGERDIVGLEVVTRVLERVGRDGKNLGAALLELVVPVSQLREMPAAERSHEAAQKDQDDGLPAQFR